MKFHSMFKRYLTIVTDITILEIFFLSWSVISYAKDLANTTDWFQWRGPNRDGISSEKDWLSNWPEEGPKQFWKIQVGWGYSSVTVSSKFSSQYRSSDENKNGLVYAMGNLKNTDTVYCLDADTGDVVWQYSYPCGQGTWKGTRIAPTVDGDVVYTLSSEGHLFCFDAVSGKIIWSKKVKTELNAKPPSHGFACHPFIYGDMLILEIGAEGGSVVALDKKDGRLIWQSGADKVGYSTPMTYNLKGKDYLVVLTGMALVGMNLSDGRPLWWYKWQTPNQCNIVTPIVSGDKVYISSGYKKGSALLQIRPDKNPKTIWKNKRMANHFNSCVQWQGYLYGFHGAPNHKPQKGELRCLDFNTGELKWKHRGNMDKGSLMIADGKLIILSEHGELVIAAASPEGFEELARTKVLDGTCWTMPVLSGGRIYCRDHEGTLVCVDVRQK